MRQIFLIAAIMCLPAMPIHAEDDGKDNGLSLMEEGARLFMEGIMREMEPAMDDLRGLAEGVEPKLREFVREMGPALADILGKVENLSNYHPPEMLPNGDIILRKKVPDTVQEPPEDEIEI
ncbi:hypothetical protein [Roseovarius sp. SYSU LYC5161]|jgi:hypothetical protein|uniref:hypothetical protein n=1 Tax=Roseovarius halophilus (ex Wu et al. 2025) TaxID=3376060 RepID=UPI002870C28F|nr:hypothetical protein [Roseovarius sp.]